MCEKVQLEPRILPRDREKWNYDNNSRVGSNSRDYSIISSHPPSNHIAKSNIINKTITPARTSQSCVIEITRPRYGSKSLKKISHRARSSSLLPRSQLNYKSKQNFTNETGILRVMTDCDVDREIMMTDPSDFINMEEQQIVVNSSQITTKIQYHRTLSCQKREEQNLHSRKQSATRKTRATNTSIMAPKSSLILVILLIGIFQLSVFTYEVQNSLIIGDSAIEIQEMDPNRSGSSMGPDMDNQGVVNIGNGNGVSNGNDNNNNLLLGKATGVGDAGQHSNSILSQADSLLSPSNNNRNNNNKDTSNQNNQNNNSNNNRVSGPLPPILSSQSANGASDSSSPMSDTSIESVQEVPKRNKLVRDDGDGGNDDRAITGRVVDFELTPAGGHNKAKIKKKKKKEKKIEKKEEKKFKKWTKKKNAEKKFKEMKHMEEMKKKKQEGKKGKKKWGKEVHGQKKKGSFKKKKWGKKVKKGKGVKKGKKGKKFLADKGHKNTGFKTVYHKEEWGGSKKWHDIKREKKWDEQSKKWKKKWKKEKGKKYKGDHMKKYEKQKKHGKKYKKEKKEKFKKEKKEEFKKGKKMKKEEHMKKKEGGKKKEMKEEKKKKEVKKKKKGRK